MAADFAWRGVGAALNACRNDFSDPYFAGTLWREGLNPYDRGLATALSIAAADCHVPVVPIYPPTAYVLFAPLTFLPWVGANVVWALLTLAGVAVVAWALLRIGGFTPGSDNFWIVLAAVFTFAPLHTAMHAANVAVIVLAVVLAGVWAADRDRDWLAGLLFAVATCLKPQLGAWFLVYFLLRQRWRVIGMAAATGAGLSAVALAVMPLSFSALLANYGSNVAYWFGRGGQNDFTPANHLHYQLLNIQVLLYPLVGDAAVANRLAIAAFVLGLFAWGYALFRYQPPQTLAITSLMALSAGARRASPIKGM